MLEGSKKMETSLIFEKRMDFTGHRPLIETTKWFLKDLKSLAYDNLLSYPIRIAARAVQNYGKNLGMVPSFPDSIPSFLSRQYEQF